MEQKTYPRHGRPLKVVCPNGHTLAELPTDKDTGDDEVVEIKCHRCKHYVQVIVDFLRGRIKVKNGSVTS